MPAEETKETKGAGKGRGRDAGSGGAADLQNAPVARHEGRGMPHSEEAEKGLIGSILIAPEEVLSDGIQQVVPEYFHLPSHRIIYEQLLAMWDKNQQIDIVTATQALRDKSQLDQVGGPARIAELFSFVPTAANAGFYRTILREKYLLRQIIGLCTKFSVRAYDAQDEVHQLVDEFEAGAYAVNSERLSTTQAPLKDLIMRVIEDIEKINANKGQVAGLSTGFKGIDKLLSGLHPAEMIVIAARPSMGKTALAMNIAEHVVLNERKPVAVFSLEMSTSQLIQRLLGSMARIDLSRMRNGFLSHADFDNLVKAAGLLADCPLYIDDTPSIPILELRAKARRLKSSKGIELVVIDYLQLIRSPSKRGLDSRQQEISEVSAGVKALAKELEVPVIVLAQLNRQPDARNAGEPRLSDLRESGSIEQDADVVGLLYRPDYYNKEDSEGADNLGKAELKIDKQRNGPVGKVLLTFLKEYTRFEDRIENSED